MVHRRRHGQRRGAAADRPLDPDGVDQRRALAAVLRRHQQRRAAPLAEQLHRARARLLQVEHRHVGEGLVQARQVGLQGCALGAEQAHRAIPTGTPTSVATTSTAPTRPVTIETVLSTSARTAIGSSGSARLGIPMSRRAAKTISAPLLASVTAQEPSKSAMSPASWAKVMVIAARSNRSSSVQRRIPARKVTSQDDTVVSSSTWVTVTSRTASLSSGYRVKSVSVR